MDQPYFITAAAILAAICWAIVSAGAGVAVFTRATCAAPFSCLGLSAVSFTALGEAWRIVHSGWASEGSAALALAAAIYALSCILRIYRRIRK